MDNPIIPALPTIDVDPNLSATGLTELTRTVEILEEDLPTLQQTSVEMQRAIDSIAAQTATLKDIIDSLTNHSDSTEQKIESLQTAVAVINQSITELNTLSIDVDTVIGEVEELQTTVSEAISNSSAALSNLWGDVTALAAAQPVTFVASSRVNLVSDSTTTLNHRWKGFKAERAIVLFDYEIINKSANVSYNPGDRLTVTENFTGKVTDTQLIVLTLNRGIHVYDRDRRRTTKINLDRWDLLIKAVAYVV